MINFFGGEQDTAKVQLNMNRGRRVRRYWHLIASVQLFQDGSSKMFKYLEPGKLFQCYYTFFFPLQHTPRYPLKATCDKFLNPSNITFTEDSYKPNDWEWAVCVCFQDLDPIEVILLILIHIVGKSNKNSSSLTKIRHGKQLKQYWMCRNGSINCTSGNYPLLNISKLIASVLIDLHQQS